MTPPSVLAKLLIGLALLAAGLGASAATVPDTIEQRVAACIACHGREGSSTNAGYFPRLAGKPAGYLFNQLQSFRDGRRYQSDMVYMTRHMSDAYLREIAEYFANIDLPYPRVNPATDATPQMLSQGQSLALRGDAKRGIPACVACHGPALMGVQPGVPPLLGLPRLYIASQLGAWLTDDRHALPPDCMTDVGRRLDTADINAVASWLATQPVPANAKPARSPAVPLPLKCSAMP